MLWILLRWLLFYAHSVDYKLTFCQPTGFVLLGGGLQTLLGAKARLDQGKSKWRPKQPSKEMKAQRGLGRDVATHQLTRFN